MVFWVVPLNPGHALSPKDFTVHILIPHSSLHQVLGTITVKSELQGWLTNKKTHQCNVIWCTIELSLAGPLTQQFSGCPRDTGLIHTFWAEFPQILQLEPTTKQKKRPRVHLPWLEWEGLQSRQEQQNKGLEGTTIKLGTHYQEHNSQNISGHKSTAVL